MLFATLLEDFMVFTRTQSAMEQRKFERYQINVPATIDCIVGRHTVHAHTKNLSAGGGLFGSSGLVKSGQRVAVQLALRNKTIVRLTGAHCQLRIYGTVVRSEPKGMAIKFSDHEIKRLNCLISRRG